MPDLAAQLSVPTGGFELEGMMMRYSIFVPRLYNFCKSLGMEAGKILPSRAFCSDENQGYPIILITKHFGTFPFNHGRVGGMVSTERHGPHADHGEHLVIIQASHVGYNPETKRFGEYKRQQTNDHEISHTCGKIYGLMNWYQIEYDFACKNIVLEKRDGKLYVTVDNHLLRSDVDEGLILKLEKLLKKNGEGELAPVSILSTAKTYVAADEFVARLNASGFAAVSKMPIGSNLTADMFYYRRNIELKIEGAGQELNLIKYMPTIVTSPAPGMLAAQINTQVEFDRTFRTLVKEKAYVGKNLLFISGLHIDISPLDEQLFPLTKFVPWAAYVQKADGEAYILEQNEIHDELERQSKDNPDQIDLEQAIQQMQEAREIKVEYEH